MATRLLQRGPSWAWRPAAYAFFGLWVGCAVPQGGHTEAGPSAGGKTDLSEQIIDTLQGIRDWLTEAMREDGSAYELTTEGVTRLLDAWGWSVPDARYSNCRNYGGFELPVGNMDVVPELFCAPLIAPTLELGGYLRRAQREGPYEAFYWPIDSDKDRDVGGSTVNRCEHAIDATAPAPEDRLRCLAMRSIRDALNHPDDPFWWPPFRRWRRGLIEGVSLSRDHAFEGAVPTLRGDRALQAHEALMNRGQSQMTCAEVREVRAQRPVVPVHPCPKSDGLWGDAIGRMCARVAMCRDGEATVVSAVGVRMPSFEELKLISDDYSRVTLDSDGKYAFLDETARIKRLFSPRDNASTIEVTFVPVERPPQLAVEGHPAQEWSFSSSYHATTPITATLRNPSQLYDEDLNPRLNHLTMVLTAHLEGTEPDPEGPGHLFVTTEAPPDE